MSRRKKVIVLHEETKTIRYIVAVIILHVVVVRIEWGDIQLINLFCNRARGRW